MKRLCTAVFLCVGLLVAYGCSSAPSGTVAVGDVLKMESELLGQQVVVLGRAETQTAMSQFNMFKIYKGGDNLWVEFPEMDTMPPQAEKIRVEGIVKKKKFSGIPEEQLYIEAKSVTLE